MNFDLEIDFLYFEDCPSHEDALQRLRDVLAAEAQIARIEIFRVETDAEAHEQQFVGSPTIRLNGQDVAPPAPGTPYALTCRVYQHEDGRMSPLPSEEMIRRTLRDVLQTTD
jgi:hypothetical protein